MYMRALLFVVLNLLFWGLIFLVQEVEEHEGYIPARRKAKTKQFRYIQDWRTSTLGDWVGLSFIDAAAAFVFSPQDMPLVFAAVLMGSVSAFGMHMRFMDGRHRPDSGYPKAGSVSISGFLHMMYFVVQFSVAAYLFLVAVTDPMWGRSLLLALAGAGVYLLALISDIQEGAFHRLSK